MLELVLRIFKNRVSVAIGLFALACLLLIVTSAIDTVYQRNSIALENHVIENQSFLLRNYLGHDLEWSEGVPLTYSIAPERLRTTAQALVNGGVARIARPHSLDVLISPPPTKAIRNILSQQQKLVEAFLAEAAAIDPHRSKVNPASYDFTHLEKLVEEHSGLSVQAIRLLDRYSRHRSYILAAFESMLSVVLGVLLFLVLARESEAYKNLQLEVESRRAAQKKLAHLNKNLEAEVETRTRELRTFSEELLRSNRELDQFTNIISHDLRAPLRSAHVMLQLLVKQSKLSSDERTQKTLLQLMESIKQTHQLIEHLLKYARLGAAALETNQVSSNNLLKSALYNLRSEIESKKPIIHFAKEVSICVDEAQFILVFQNLLGNALKYSVNRPEIWISVVERLDDFLFCIRDNGVGIQPRFRERIFQMFQRIDNGMGVDGSGIGLATVKKIVERHGGRIWVESQIGEGSSFYFSVPKTAPTMKRIASSS